jgi:hypothetical protein
MILDLVALTPFFAAVLAAAGVSYFPLKNSAYASAP